MYLFEDNYFHEVVFPWTIHTIFSFHMNFVGLSCFAIATFTIINNEKTTPEFKLIIVMGKQLHENVNFYFHHCFVSSNGIFLIVCMCLVYGMFFAIKNSTHNYNQQNARQIFMLVVRF